MNLNVQPKRSTKVVDTADMAANPVSARPTLRDVSQRTGLSVYSVSRALSGEKGVSEATRARVQTAAREVGYVANQLARSLKGNSSRTIGILAGGTANQYYATLIGAFDQALRDANFQSILADTMADGDYGRDRESRMVSALLEQRVAAVVVTYSLAPANLKLITDWGIPLLFVDCVPPRRYAHYPAVTADNEQASTLVGDHFAAHGYRRWAFVGYPKRWSSRLPREHAFREAARRHGATVDVIETGNDAATPYPAMAAYLAGHPAGTVDAIYCANTPLLQGTLRAIRDDGRRVGTDLGVIAFDEFDWAALLQPSITVIDQHITDIGRDAAAKLLDELADGQDASESGTLLVPPTLIVRESCGCSLPAGRGPAAAPTDI
jgi:LacI family transcriptional regulator